MLRRIAREIQKGETRDFSLLSTVNVQLNLQPLRGGLSFVILEKSWGNFVIFFPSSALRDEDQLDKVVRFFCHTP